MSSQGNRSPSGSLEKGLDVIIDQGLGPCLSLAEKRQQNRLIFLRIGRCKAPTATPSLRGCCRDLTGPTPLFCDPPRVVALVVDSPLAVARSAGVVSPKKVSAAANGICCYMRCAHGSFMLVVEYFVHGFVSLF